jgi:DNA modification methylase
MKIEQVGDSYAICADSTAQLIIDSVKYLVGEVPLIIADPPYGKIVSAKWDRTNQSDVQFSNWLLAWTRDWACNLVPGGSMYVWGGIGKVGFRPFFRYLVNAEVPSEFELANLITWKKRRGYGKSRDYLFCREECAWFVKGDSKHPRCFNIPLLGVKRGYAGYNAKYPAKSEFLRRSNVWVEPELLRGKVHEAQKAQRVIEIPIEVHTQPGEWVIDPFAGSGTTAFAAMKLGRKFVVIERDEQTFEEMLVRLRAHVNEHQSEVVLNHGNHAEADTDQGNQRIEVADQAEVALSRHGDAGRPTDA